MNGPAPVCFFCWHAYGLFYLLKRFRFFVCTDIFTLIYGVLRFLLFLLIFHFVWSFCVFFTKFLIPQVCKVRQSELLRHLKCAKFPQLVMCGDPHLELLIFTVQHVLWFEQKGFENVHLVVEVRLLVRHIQHARDRVGYLLWLRYGAYLHEQLHDELQHYWGHL